MLRPSIRCNPSGITHSRSIDVAQSSTVTTTTTTVDKSADSLGRARERGKTGTESPELVSLVEALDNGI